MAMTLLGLVGLVVVRRISDVRDVVAWDLTSTATDQLPPADVVRADMAIGDVDLTTADGMASQTDHLLKRQTVQSVVAVALVAVPVIAHATVQPKASEPLLAVAVWLPGIVGALALVTTLIPGLVRLLVYRSTVVASVRLVAASGMVAATEPGADTEPASAEPIVLEPEQPD